MGDRQLAAGKDDAGHPRKRTRLEDDRQESVPDASGSLRGCRGGGGPGRSTLRRLLRLYRSHGIQSRFLVYFACDGSPRGDRQRDRAGRRRGVDGRHTGVLALRRHPEHHRAQHSADYLRRSPRGTDVLQAEGFVRAVSIMNELAHKLEVIDIKKKFGGVCALDLDGQRLSFNSGKITAILGGNGAGKTTLLNIINGIFGGDSGSVLLDHSRIDGLPAWKRNHIGMARLWQDLRLFENLSCADNVEVSIHGQRGERVSVALVARAVIRREHEQNRKKALSILARVGLIDERDRNAAELSYGQQKLLALGRAICNEDASIMLLDEPMAGLDVRMSAKVATLLEEMERQNKIIIIIEHDLRNIKHLIDYVFFLDRSRCIAQGTTTEVLSSEGIRRRYMGIQ